MISHVAKMVIISEKSPPVWFMRKPLKNFQLESPPSGAGFLLFPASEIGGRLVLVVRIPPFLSWARGETFHPIKLGILLPPHTQT